MPEIRRIVVALGGNAILRAKQRGTFFEQFANVRRTCRQIVAMIQDGYKVVITHGNGPQVGAILIQNEMGASVVPAMPLDVLGAESQGLIGYMLQQNLYNLLLEQNLHYPVVTVITQVLVDKDDPAFTHPTKPIGPFYSEEKARQAMIKKGETWIEDSGRGWRKVVPSPEPIGIVEREGIRALLEAGVVVIASGGGGIPVVEVDGGRLQGIRGVIDKDLAGQRLATDVDADCLLILTDVPKVALYFNTPQQQDLDRMTVAEARRYMEEGHFRPGSMGPKVKASICFIESGGECAIITSIDTALAALRGEAGTWIVA
ncbi:MAG: carbamate kinase [Anaerolineae bacterium]